MARDIGKQITDDYMEKQPIAVGILKGSEPFHAELIKHINLPIVIDFIQASSYNGGIETGGNVKIKRDIESNITDKDVILVEDIVDS